MTVAVLNLVEEHCGIVKLPEHRDTTSVKGDCLDEVMIHRISTKNIPSSALDEI